MIEALLEYILSLLSINKGKPLVSVSGLFVIVLLLLTATGYSCGSKKSPEEQISNGSETTNYKLGKRKEREESTVNSEEKEPVEYEELSVLKASEILPEEILKSDLHHVSEEVKSDCVWNSYTIDSEFGEFDAYNSSILEG